MQFVGSMWWACFAFGACQKQGENGNSICHRSCFISFRYFYHYFFRLGISSPSLAANPTFFIDREQKEGNSTFFARSNMDSHGRHKRKAVPSGGKKVDENCPLNYPEIDTATVLNIPRNQRYFSDHEKINNELLYIIAESIPWRIYRLQHTITLVAIQILLCWQD